MKVCLVSYEDPNAWILGKLVLSLSDELAGMGISVEVRRQGDPAADINHHFIYRGYDGVGRGIDTLMITHVDTADKVELLRNQLTVARMGVCLSSDTLAKLTALGLPRSRLCYANYPSPQAGKIVRRKVQIGVTSRCHASGCKREYLLGELAQRIAADDFEFHFMGAGWDVVMKELRNRGVDVRYHGDFESEAYRRLFSQLDYYLYPGQDEGSTGLLDALEAGVPTIATPQGFHLDLPNGVTHAFHDLDELVSVFQKLSEDRQQLRRSAGGVNWSSYAHRHLALWRHLLNERAGAPSDEDRELLASMGVVTAAGPDAGPFRWTSAMPQDPGPGGAAHRTRLLVVYDEPRAGALEAWRQICQAAPLDLPVWLSGDEASPAGVEIKLLDRRDVRDADLLPVSLDFDAVVFFNFASSTLADLLGERIKPNFLLRTSAMSALFSDATGSRRHLLPLAKALRSRSQPVLVGIWTRAETPGPSPSGRPLDAVIATEPEVFASAQGSLQCLAPRVHSGIARGEWEPAFLVLFSAIARRHADEDTRILSVARKLDALGRWGRRLVRRITEQQ